MLRQCILSLQFVVLVFLCIQFSYPAYSAGSTDKTHGSLTEALAVARVQLLEAIEVPEAQQKDELKILYQAQAFQQKSTDVADKIKRLNVSARNAPVELDKLQKQLDLLQHKQVPKLNQRVTVSRLAELLAKAKSELDTVRQKRISLENEVSQRSRYRESIPKLNADAQKRLDEIKQAQREDTDIGLSKYIHQAQQYLWGSERRYSLALIEQYEVELDVSDVSQNILRSQRQLAEMHIILSEQKVAILEEKMASLRLQQAKDAQATAEEARRKADASSGITQDIAQDTAALAAEQAEVISAVQKYSVENQIVAETASRLNDSLQYIKSKEARSGLTKDIGLRLRSQLLQLPNIGELQQQSKTLYENIEHVQARRIALEDTLFTLVDINSEARKRLLSLASPLNKGEYAQALESISKALVTQKNDYLLPLIESYDDYVDRTLLPLQEYHRKLLQVTETYQQYIVERILYVQSAPAISFENASGLKERESWYFNQESWLTVYEAIRHNWKNQQGKAFALLVIFTLLFFGAKKQRQLLNQYGENAVRFHQAKLFETLYCIGITLAMSAVWPTLFLFVSAAVSSNAVTSFTHAISTGLAESAILLWVVVFIYTLARPGGLADKHFNWPIVNLRLIRRNLQWYIPFVFLASFFVNAAPESSVEVLPGTQGRMAFIFAMFATSVLIWFSMHPDKGIPVRFLASRRDGWWDKLKYIWFVLLLLVPLSLATVAATGYFYTALKLSEHIYYSLVLFLIMFIIYAVLLRWLHLVQVNVLLQQSKAEGTEEKTVFVAVSESETEPQKLDLELVKGQAISLVRSFMLAFTVIGFYLIWQDVMPAFGRLSSVELWRVSIDIASSVAAEGSAGVAPAYRVISLADLVQALLIAVVATITARNIPGMMEMVVLQWLPIAPSSRYAITTVVRYVIVILGVILTFGSLGLGWSKLQFLAAAITVGLGFGLQEIFANFVSGLIILFERQVRVGDVVTVGAISGEVSRIHMRATTIVDWNRKELIIPNKEFVTGQVINWSLSDSLLRLDVPVGIAYGSDVELATKILLNIAKSVPTVYAEPSAGAPFIKFGDSSLNLELRVFIRFDTVVSTRDSLLRKIDVAFKDADIEISFPQRDIHIRSLPPAEGNPVVNT